MEREMWEGLAAAIHDETGGDDPPVSAFALASVMGIRLVPWNRGDAELDGDVIRFPSRARLTRQHGLIAHELGHWSLRWASEPDSEEGARYLAGALMLPRQGFDQDLRSTWNVEQLRAKHLHASAQMIATRLCQLRDAVASIFDEGKLKQRIVSPWLSDRRLERATRWEHEIAAEALASGETVRGDELCYAVPIFDRGFRRVVVVCEPRQLSLRIEQQRE